MPKATSCFPTVWLQGLRLPLEGVIQGDSPDPGLTGMKAWGLSLQVEGAAPRRKGGGTDAAQGGQGRWREGHSSQPASAVLPLFGKTIRHMFVWYFWINVSSLFQAVSESWQSLGNVTAPWSGGKPSWREGRHCGWDKNQNRLLWVGG